MLAAIRNEVQEISIDLHLERIGSKVAWRDLSSGTLRSPLYDDQQQAVDALKRFYCGLGTTISFQNLALPQPCLIS